VHDDLTYEMINKIEVPLPISDTKEPNEIINIKVSYNEEFLGVLSGKLLPKGIEKIEFLHIYKITSCLQIDLIKEIKIPKEYSNVSKSFDFLKNKKNQILFLSKSNVIIHDFNQGTFTVV